MGLPPCPPFAVVVPCLGTQEVLGPCRVLQLLVGVGACRAYQEGVEASCPCQGLGAFLEVGACLGEALRGATCPPFVSLLFVT
jgi:hypothetical protein